MPSVNLLRVIPTMDPSSGGPCQGIRNMGPPLRSLGIQDEVVCLDEPTESADPFRVHRIGRGRGPWRYSSRLRPWLDENLERFDAVIVHALWLYHSFAVARAIVTRRKRGQCVPKLLVMPHGMLDPWFQRDSSRRIKAVRNWFYWKLIEKRVVAEADAILFTCQRELELAREPFQPYQPKREINAGYGVAEPPPSNDGMADCFRERCPDLEVGRPFLLYLSRIHPKKGIGNLVKAYSELGELNVELPALVIAGPLDTEFARKVQRSLEQRGLCSERGPNAPRVLFTGMLQGDAKWGAFYGCDAFILPSHQENFGIAVVEALACGKPVLISNQINIYREIETAEAAFVADDTEDGVRELILGWLALSSSGRQEMSRAARVCYDTQFRPDAAAKRLLTTIEGLG